MLGNFGGVLRNTEDGAQALRKVCATTRDRAGVAQALILHQPNAGVAAAHVEQHSIGHRRRPSDGPE